MQTGTVRWFSYSKGCGLIIPDDGTADVYAHFSQFTDGGMASLAAHQRVGYRVRTGPSGRWAHDIHELSQAHLRRVPR